MDTPTLLFKRVEYHTSRVDFGTGLVVEHHPATGRVVVVDEDDSSRWAGYEDHVDLLDD